MLRPVPKAVLHDQERAARRRWQAQAEQKLKELKALSDQEKEPTTLVEEKEKEKRVL